MSSTALYKFSSSSGTGTWDFNNSLGSLFTTFSDLVLTHLGIFDSAGDGITTPITVRLYYTATSTVVASITFSGDGVLENGFRYKALASPITLPALTAYTIAGGSFVSPNTGWQTGDGGSWSEAQIGGRVLSGVAVTGPADAVPTAQFTKFTRVGVSFKGRDEGALPSAELLFGATIQGTYSPIITLPITLSGSVTGDRFLSGSANLPISFSTTITGEATGTIQATATLPINVFSTVTAGLILDSGADLPITFSGIATAGLSVLLPITFSGSVTGNLILDSSSTLPITFSSSVTGQGILNPSINLPITFSSSVTGEGTSNLSVNLPISFASSATANLTGEVSSTAAITFTASATAALTANGEATLPITFSGTIDLSAYGEGTTSANIAFAQTTTINGQLEVSEVDSIINFGADFPPTVDGGTIEQASTTSRISWAFQIIPPDTITPALPPEPFVPPSGTPVWLTDRDGTAVMTVPFNLQMEFAPMAADAFAAPGSNAAIQVHWLKRSTIYVSPSQDYTTTPVASINAGFVRIEPYLKVVPGTYRMGTTPYPPDSPVQYRWLPYNNPSGGWVQQDVPLVDVQYGWRITAYFGLNSTLSSPVQTSIIFAGTTTFWGVIVPTGERGSMGGLTYSSYGFPGDPSGLTYRVSWPIPDDWERTHGPTYGASISGTIVFSSAYEEYFVNSDVKTSYNSAVVNGELGIGDGNTDPWPPRGRRYGLRNHVGQTRSLNVNVTGGFGSISLSETIPARGGVPWSPYTFGVNTTTFVHSLGTAGASLSSTATTGGTLTRLGGGGISGLSNTLSNSRGSASAGLVTANTMVITGSPSPNYGGGYLPGAGQTYRNGVKYGYASTLSRISFPENVTIAGTLAKLPSAVNAEPVGIIIHNHNEVTPLRTVSGVTGGFSENFTYESRGLFLQVGATIKEYPETATYPSGSFINTKVNFPGDVGVLVSTGISKFNLPRMGLRGRSWNLWNAKLPTSVNLHGDWSGATAGSGATIGVSGGVIQFNSSVGATGFTAKLGTSSKVSETRYFKIKVRSVGSDTESVRLRYIGAGDLDWTFETDVDGVWKEIDLDSYESFAGPTQYYTPPTLPAVNGFSNYWQFDCPTDTVIEVEYLRGTIHTFELLDIVSTKYPDIAMWGTADGRGYLLGLGDSTIMPASPGGWQYTLAATPSSLKPWYNIPPYNRNIGGGTYPDAWYFDADHYELAHGLGLMLNPGLNTGFNLRNEFADIGDGLDVKAQDVLERVILYPGCGDVFGGTGAAFGDSTTLRFGLLLDGAITTLEFKDDPDIDLVDIVALKDSDSSEQGRSHPIEPEGYAYLNAGLPQAVAHTLQYDPNDGSTSLPANLVNRVIYRTLWLKSGEAIELLCYNMTGEQRHHAYYIATNGDLRLIRVFQEVSGVIGATPSVGTSQDTLIQAGNYSYPNAMELSGMYSSSELGDLRHGGGIHAVGAINKDTGHIQLFVSTDRGETWRVETLSQTYSALQMVEHRGRIIATGWNGGSWYAFVGTPRAYTGGAGSGEYEWSNASGLGSVVVATNKKSARLWVSEAGVINFAYLDNSGTPKILRCSSISKTGSGTWD